MLNNEILIPPETTLFEALEIMDRVERKLLVICDNTMKFYGVISVGDIQRAILGKRDLNSAVVESVRSDIIFARQEDKKELIKGRMTKDRIESMPVVNREGILIDIIDWEEIFEDEETINKDEVMFPVVIMAGGEGRRLRPLTNIIPKPLIPVSSKTIIEEIMEKFARVGCREFYLSLNYKAQLIKDYFSNKTTDYEICYVEEEEPLGTAGSLYLFKERLKNTFFMTNCDILFDVELAELVKYHKENNNLVTIVSVIKSYSIPYGTIETKENGMLTCLTEKPDYIYQINSGLYVLEPEVFSYIEDNEYLHLPDLIQRILGQNGRVGVFPIPEGCWTDMGNWDEYLKLVSAIKRSESKGI